MAVARLAAYQLLRVDNLVAGVVARRRVRRRTGCHAPSSVGDGEAESTEQVLVTAAVLEDIPAGWDARRVHRVRADDTGSMSVVLP